MVLALRDQGNLLNILRVQQRVQPRRQWILEPSEELTSMRGNRVLAKAFPDWHQPLMGSSGTNFDASPSGVAAYGQRKEPAPIAWDRYLYHYTRACPGPWPGQSELDYLTSVLDGELTCGHSALDTLLRILREGCIRGSRRLVRGLEAVISWTSRPPRDLAAIRHWNRALGRWTFEPYGIAVNRQWLRNQGAKPAIYGAGTIFERLPAGERFRFQVGDANRAVWRLEREWRLLGDLRLDGTMDVLVLVPDAAAAERIAAEIACPYRVIVT